ACSEDTIATDLPRKLIDSFDHYSTLNNGTLYSTDSNYEAIGSLLSAEEYLDNDNSLITNRKMQNACSEDTIATDLPRKLIDSFDHYSTLNNGTLYST
ncbi:hypothetical protein, partial [Salmonella sp. s51228]|uniref:hypothetical protein n=1 Tax=Salmonella sp. s51228 TaxID=3159652 RepID=UPI0039809F46